MMRILLFAMLMLTSTIALAQTDESIHADPLDYRWENRIIIIIAESESDSLYKTQLAEFIGEENGFKERDLITFHIIKDGVSRLDEQVLYDSSVTAILEKYGSEKPVFRILLIGKDGGVKLKRDFPVTVEDVFGLIDSMPMRQREMRQGSGR